ncbi:hypothetical protein LTR94_025530 [Friedmanniomyces endolithicus]|nr:hypothetical protein LTR94_025530 [Friedmanniomyces endolithicus]
MAGAMSETSRAVRKVTIVGGGTAGWMAAALLSRLFAGGGFDIRLIESDEIGTIGVGEATIPAIQTFNRMLGIDEDAFVAATGGTFKLGIQFENWRAIGDRYFHPFGQFGHDIDGLAFHQLFLKLAGQRRCADLWHYAPCAVAAAAGRFARIAEGEAPFPLPYAFHFDAGRYARFLRDYAEARGVERIEGRIADVAQHADTGFVQAVRLADGRHVDGELFVDCSGFRGLLIEGALASGYDDWSHWLPCDRAVAVPTARDRAPVPYTRAIAQGAGWQWRIPLQHRTGNGHVYASDYISDDDAAATLLANLDAAPLADPRPVRFVPGRRLRAWDKNVVAIGLSSGFLEPLESTSIHLIQTALLRLVALFPGEGVKPADVAEYNRQTAFEMTDIRDFIIAHYKVTEREDTPFWAYVKHMAIPDSLAERLELFRTSARFFLHSRAELFREESWVQVLIGQGLAMRHDPMVDLIPDADALAYLRDIEAVIDDVSARMPDHAAFVARNCSAAATPAR